MRNYWPLALTISLLFHAALFTNSHSIKKILSPDHQASRKKKTTDIEIIPQKIKKTPADAESAPRRKPLPYIKDLIGNLKQQNHVSRLNKPKIFKKNIVFSSDVQRIDKELLKNRAYMDYYRLIREKIRSSAFNNYTGSGEGKILAGFTILNNGCLKNVNVTPESIPDGSLKQTALRSIEDSSPFPEFPAELKKYSSLRFNISIHFKNN